MILEHSQMVRELKNIIFNDFQKKQFLPYITYMSDKDVQLFGSSSHQPEFKIRWLTALT